MRRRASGEPRPACGPAGVARPVRRDAGGTRGLAPRPSRGRGSGAVPPQPDLPSPTSFHRPRSRRGSGRREGKCFSVERGGRTARKKEKRNRTRRPAVRTAAPRTAPRPPSFREPRRHGFASRAVPPCCGRRPSRPSPGGGAGADRRRRPRPLERLPRPALPCPAEGAQAAEPALSRPRKEPCWGRADGERRQVSLRRKAFREPRARAGRNPCRSQLGVRVPRDPPAGGRRGGDDGPGRASRPSFSAVSGVGESPEAAGCAGARLRLEGPPRAAARAPEKPLRAREGPGAGGLLWPLPLRWGAPQDPWSRPELPRLGDRGARGADRGEQEENRVPRQVSQVNWHFLLCLTVADPQGFFAGMTYGKASSIQLRSDYSKHK